MHFLGGYLSTNLQPQLTERPDNPSPVLLPSAHHGMDPLTALSVACNVIDLVSTAISCGLAVKDIYKSVDGRTKANVALKKEDDGMKDVVVLLREKNSKIKVFTDDEDIQKKVSLCTEALRSFTSFSKTAGTRARRYGVPSKLCSCPV